MGLRHLCTTVTTDHKLEWFGTSRSRLGFLATPNLLLYGTGGVAYGQTKDTYTAAAVGFAAAVATVKDVRAGWTVGGGIEGVLRRRLECKGRIPLYGPRQTGADHHVPSRRHHRRELQQPR